MKVFAEVLRRKSHTNFYLQESTTVRTFKYYFIKVCMLVSPHFEKQDGKAVPRSISAKALRISGKFDLILCRNILIYFETKKKILSELQRSLAPKGLLLLGRAESTLNLDSGLVKSVYDQAIFYQAP